MKHDFNDTTNVCKVCGVERVKNTKREFFMRNGRLVNEPVCVEGRCSSTARSTSTSVKT